MKPAPLHERIRSTIEKRILAGEWPPGHRVPGETELMAEYSCARMTVNKALSALAAKGLVERRRRAGTFVARPSSQSLALDIADLAAEVAARGQKYAWRLTSRAVIDQPAIDMPGPLLKTEGVHLADDSPLTFEERFVSLHAVPAIAEADLVATPPGTWLLTHVPWTEAEHRIGAAAADNAIARALDLPPGSPCLTVTRRTWRKGDLVTLVRQFFVAGQHELVARFGHSPITRG